MSPTFVSLFFSALPLSCVLNEFELSGQVSPLFEYFSLIWPTVPLILVKYFRILSEAYMQRILASHHFNFETDGSSSYVEDFYKISQTKATKR